MYACTYILQDDVDCHRDDLMGEDDTFIAETFLNYRVFLATSVESAQEQAIREVVSEFNDACDPEDEDSPVPLLLEDLTVDHEVSSGINRIKRGDEVIAYVNIYPVEMPT